MKHPQSRGERRFAREIYISRRKFIIQHIWYWSLNEIPHEGSPWYQQQEGWYQEPIWGKYAKFNLNCGHKMCHSEKWFEAIKRRKALDQAVLDNIDSWE
jgi:hypothetical protein